MRKKVLLNDLKSLVLHFTAEPDTSHLLVTKRTCSEVHVHKLVKNYGHLALTEGMQHHLPLQVLISGVSRVDSNSRVSQHRLNTSRGHDHLLV